MPLLMYTNTSKKEVQFWLLASSTGFTRSWTFSKWNDTAWTLLGVWLIWVFFFSLLHISLRFIQVFPCVYIWVVLSGCYIYKWVYFANTIDYSFLFLCHIPWYDYISVYMSTLLLMGIWLISSVKLPWVKPLWTFYIECKSI